MGAAAAIDSIPPALSQPAITASSLPFPTKGVKLSFANEFYDLCGGYCYHYVNRLSFFTSKLLSVNLFYIYYYNFLIIVL
jgi:hypothetical protein